MKKILSLFLFLLAANFLYSQTILNTEKLMSKIDSTFVFGIGFDGNMERGNIELTESNLSLQIGKKLIIHSLDLYLVMNMKVIAKKYYQMILVDKFDTTIRL